MNKMKRIGREKVELGVTETTMHISTHHIVTDTFLSWVHSKKIGFVIKFVDAEGYFTQMYSSQTFLPDKVFFLLLSRIPIWDLCIRHSCFTLSLTSGASWSTRSSFHNLLLLPVFLDGNCCLIRWKLRRSIWPRCALWWDRDLQWCINDPSAWHRS